MEFNKYRVYSNDPPPRPAAELAAERREQFTLQQAALQADKDRNLARQRAMDTPPATRIALWESRHGLALPRDPKHPLMRIIAENTDLDLSQVLAEHERRALLRAGH
ncbi:MAG TPA: hypothetical protein VFI92_05195 [Steroidobacteraceae bacterium]|nr:hypothetical protein [Steroidobacteraceae bacterium]